MPEVINNQVIPLLSLSILCYLVSLLLYLTGIRNEDPRAFRPARALTFVALAFGVAGFVIIGFARGQVPLASAADFLVAMALIVSIMSLSLDLARGMRVLTLAAAAACFLNISAALPLLTRIPADNLAGFWSGVHVIVFLGSFAVLEISFVSSVTHLLLQKYLKRKAGLWVFEVAPSLETVRAVNVSSLAFGFLLFTAGLITAYFYARSAPPSDGWRTNPKIWATTFSWLAYFVAVVFGVRSAFRGRAFAAFNIVAFLSILLTFLVTFLAPGFHRFV